MKLKNNKRVIARFNEMLEQGVVKNRRGKQVARVYEEKTKSRCQRVIPLNDVHRYWEDLLGKSVVFTEDGLLATLNLTFKRLHIEYQDGTEDVFESCIGKNECQYISYNMPMWYDDHDDTLKMYVEEWNGDLLDVFRLIR